MSRGIKRALLAVMLAALAFLAPSPALAAGRTAYGVCTAAGALLAMLMLRQTRMADVKKRYAHLSDGPIAAIFKADHLDLALWCIPGAFIGARLAYCLSRFSFYFLEMGLLSVLRTWEGGFLLYGAALGALLAAALLAKRRGANIPQTLDELAAPGLLAVAVCRLGEWTVGEGVGAWVENEALMRFPFAVKNEFEEWQLAVFLLEAAVAVILMLVVLRVKAGEGERITAALLLYACCQVTLESMRMDSCLKIGFVRVSQVISAAVILGVTSLRAYRAGGKRRIIRRAIPFAACVAAVGGVEWALDKTPVSNVLLYGVMIAACAPLYVNASRWKSKEIEEKRAEA